MTAKTTSTLQILADDQHFELLTEHMGYVLSVGGPSTNLTVSVSIADEHSTQEISLAQVAELQGYSHKLIVTATINVTNVQIALKERTEEPTTNDGN